MVNYLTILISGIISMFIGFLWYGPLFGKQWIKLSKITDKEIKEAKKKSMGKIYFTAFIGTLVTSLVLSLLINYLEAITFVEGAWVGFLIWIGFFVTSKIGSILWENKSVKLYLFNISYDLIVLLIAGGILATWD